MRGQFSVGIVLESEEVLSVTVALYDDEGHYIDTERLSRRSLAKRTPAEALELALRLAVRMAAELDPTELEPY